MELLFDTMPMLKAQVTNFNQLRILAILTIYQKIMCWPCCSNFVVKFWSLPWHPVVWLNTNQKYYKDTRKYSKQVVFNEDNQMKHACYYKTPLEKCSVKRLLFYKMCIFTKIIKHYSLYQTFIQCVDKHLSIRLKDH